ncbi:hypothetical protein [Paraburkholderia sp. RAU2J]|uniref:hypothetical protein n=1 Tax=Paraburkholderia sp. RAU2J TaxID=1938810 RepID=UPI0013155746|nr:hypothetical protein [Paraburkholderia sp. RAU2J]
MACAALLILTVYDGVAVLAFDPVPDETLVFEVGAVGAEFELGAADEPVVCAVL